MQKAQSHIKNEGFSLVELLVAISIFLVFAVAVFGVTTNVSRQTINAANKVRASELAEEGLEATRSIRDANFANLINGTFGVTTSGNQFNLSGATDVTDIFTRRITISTINANQKQVVANVTWADQITPSNSVSLSTYLTDWQKCDQAVALSVNTAGAVLTNSNRTLSGITLGNLSASCSIVIDQVSLTWTTAARRLILIDVNGATVWTGSVASGITNDITNVTLLANTSGITSFYRFNNSVNNNTFSITYTMADGTTKLVTGIGPL